MSNVIEIAFKFIGEIAGREVQGVEVDNLARVIRVRVSSDCIDIDSVTPPTASRWFGLSDAFVTYTGDKPSDVDMFAVKRRHS